MKGGSDVYVQCAMVYTNTHLQRRIRVHTLCLPVSAEIGVVFRHLDLDTVTNVLLRNGAWGTGAWDRVHRMQLPSLHVLRHFHDVPVLKISRVILLPLGPRLSFCCCLFPAVRQLADHDLAWIESDLLRQSVEALYTYKKTCSRDSSPAQVCDTLFSVSVGQGL